MKKHEIIAALTAKGVEFPDSFTLAELKALAAQHGIDTGVNPDEPLAAPAKERIVWFRVGNVPIDAASGRAAARSKIRLKESDGQLHENAGRGTVIGYA